MLLVEVVPAPPLRIWFCAGGLRGIFHPSVQRELGVRLFLNLRPVSPSFLTSLLLYFFTSLPLTSSRPAGAGNHLSVSWTSHQYRRAEGSRILKVSQSKVRP